MNKRYILTEHTYNSCSGCSVSIQQVTFDW